MGESNQYIYRLTLTRPDMAVKGPTDAERATLNRHTEYLGNLSERGVALFYGHTQTSDESTFGIVVFTADSEASARSIMEDDPAVRDNLLSARLWPFSVAGGSLVAD